MKQCFNVTDGMFYKFINLTLLAQFNSLYQCLIAFQISSSFTQKRVLNEQKFKLNLFYAGYSLPPTTI